MQFDCRIEKAEFDEAKNLWRLYLGNGRTVTTRFVVTGIGLLSAPTMPRIPGVETFKGPSIHTFYWPDEPVDLAGKRVAVIGTGATGGRVISESADPTGAHQISGFPNLTTVAGPQSGSASTNFPRGIEIGVDWVTHLLQYLWKNGYTRVEATPEVEERWTNHVATMYSNMLMRKSKGWFTGYNSNVDGHEHGKVRHLVYNGGAPKFVATINQVADENYNGMKFE